MALFFANKLTQSISDNVIKASLIASNDLHIASIDSLQLKCVLYVMKLSSQNGISFRTSTEEYIKLFQ